MRRLTVSADGGGDFLRIQDALDSIPDDRAEWTVIAVMNGIYREKLYIDKPFVSLIGQDPSRTIVTYDDYALKTFADGELYHTFYSYTLLVGADDFCAVRITFENTAGPGEAVGQALAAYVDADRACFRDCRFSGHQDTLFTGPLPPAPRDRAAFGGPRDVLPRRPVRQYYERCTIEGDVDFIFGSATAVFSDCDIVSRRPGWITAASTPEGARYGYVFAGCRLIGDAPGQSVYLGRPWRNDAKVVFLNCWLGGHIAPAGWSRWNEAESVQDVDFAEFGSSGPGADDGGNRVAWSRQLTPEEAEAYSVKRVLSGNDGWDPVQAYDGWRPCDREAVRPVSIYLAGDSTLSEYGEELYPRQGWGQALQALFDERIAVVNEAASGRSAKSFIDEGRLERILDRLQAGDYLFIQFGHNDQKPDEARHTEPFSSYLSYLEQYVDGARRKGAIPVLLTPVERRSFDERDAFADSHGDYPEAVRKLSASRGVPLIDLTRTTKELLAAAGPEAAKKWYLWLEPGESPNYPEGATDDTHFSAYGAGEIARLVVQAVRRIDPLLDRAARRDEG